MIVYEVNLVVDAAILAEYRDWLATHVREILDFPGFLSAEILEQREPIPAPGTHALTVYYRLADAASLERYLAEQAPRLRAEGVRRFGDRFSATRRVFAPTASLPA